MSKIHFDGLVKLRRCLYVYVYQLWLSSGGCPDCKLWVTAGALSESFFFTFLLSLARAPLERKKKVYGDLFHNVCIFFRVFLRFHQTPFSSLKAYNVTVSSSYIQRNWI